MQTKRNRGKKKDKWDFSGDKGHFGNFNNFTGSLLWGPMHDRGPYPSLLSLKRVDGFDENLWNLL